MDPARAIAQLHAWLTSTGSVVVACSGGIDSLVLSTIAHRAAPDRTNIAHTVTPAGPTDATARVMAFARAEGWALELVRSREFEDERYLANPTDRCYFCKTNLYDAIDAVRATVGEATVLSGANTDDLGEYRPGLVAAAEHEVRHPYVECDIDKPTIRTIARHLELDIAELPASPCLASRLYTGTRVTEDRLRAVEMGEAVLRAAGFPVARCRIRENDVVVEVPDDVRDQLTASVLDDIERAMKAAALDLQSVRLDNRPYRPGQAILGVR